MVGVLASGVAGVALVLCNRDGDSTFLSSVDKM